MVNLEKQNSNKDPCILSEHHGLKMYTNSRNKRNLTSSWKLNNSLLSEKLKTLYNWMKIQCT